MPSFGAPRPNNASIAPAAGVAHRVDTLIINLEAHGAFSVSDIEASGNDITKPLTTNSDKNVGLPVRILHGKGNPSHLAAVVTVEELSQGCADMRHFEPCACAKAHEDR